jgi:Phosphodiester glycosidase
VLPPALRGTGQHGASRRGTGSNSQSLDDVGPDPQSPDDDVTFPRPRIRRQRRSRGRVRSLVRRPVTRVILAVIAVFLCWVAFSVGQALTAAGGGSVSSTLAEWARDHYLGPAVTFAEWMTYNPPKAGGKPSFSLAVPSGEAVRPKYAKAHGFKPIIPARLTTPAGTPLPGEGVWRVLETVKGEPAMFGTYLRPSAEYSSYVAGIVSIDQRLVTFQLHPGSEDPGPGNWGSLPYIPLDSRRGLLATFNGGFKLDTAGGGFYLNGVTRGTMTNGAASVVYYRTGTIAIGTWGSEVGMTPDVVGVRQNLKLIVDHGQVPDSVNYNVISSWGATLGGGYYVWRSGLGITKDGRVIYAYGPALNVRELADLLQQAGAVEALQLDINPFWMSFMYYEKDGHPSDPTPVNLLASQQQTAYRYYSVYSRDFTSVYARKTSLPRG